MTAQFHRDMAAAWGLNTAKYSKAISKAYADEAARLEALPAPPATPPPATPPVQPVNSVDRIVYCTKPPHEAAPHGVPTDWNWAQGPVVLAAKPPAGFTAATVWGQVYADPANEHPAGVRVAFRSLESWAHTPAGWQRLQSGQIGGAHYIEDFAGNASVPWDLRTELDGSVSTAMVPGYNIHFWVAGRGTVPPGTDAFYSTVQARLIGGTAKWLCNIGGDWWRDQTIGFGDGSNNPGIGQGRFCYLDAAWRAFDFVTMTETQIRATPPPVA